MSHFLIIIITLLIAFNMHESVAKSNVPGKQVVFTYIGQCLGKDNLPIMVHPWDITREGKNNYFVGGNVSIKEDIVDGFDSKREKNYI